MVYASRFMFDENGVPGWPAQALNYTTKTQYLFRINKGTHDPSDDTEINQFVEMRDRPIPFENMVYIGDGPDRRPLLQTGQVSRWLIRRGLQDLARKVRERWLNNSVTTVASTLLFLRNTRTELNWTKWSRPTLGTWQLARHSASS